MSDFLTFDEGADELLDHGCPSTCWFALSAKSVGATNPFAAANTLGASTLGEISGTGYIRQSQAEPVAAARAKSFAAMSWATGIQSDWPAAVRSVVLVTTADSSGKAICAWNLQTGGAARDMSQPNTTETATPTLSA